MTENAGKGKGFYKNTRFEFNGKVMDFSQPRVMGILNVTPDSFYDAGNVEKWKGDLVERMVKDGAYIIDIGAVSTRPGARHVSLEVEMERLLPVLKAVRKSFPDILISIDTYRAEVAKIAMEEGAEMINDISAGTFDVGMVPFIGKSGIPYIVMHIQGTPGTMQRDPQYDDVVEEVLEFLDKQAQKVMEYGNKQLIVDPGFGFGKTVGHNFTLLENLGRFHDIGFPVLAGISRKSMINRVLGTRPENALNGTTVLNTIALLKGANILRVHDVKEAVEAVKLVGQLGS